jgi:hypothetical protein
LNNTHRYSSLSDEQLEGMHVACEAFDQALQNNEPSHIEDYLAAAAEEIRSPLFRELLAIELERQAPDDRHAQFAIYRTRFPDRQDDIAAVFLELTQALDGTGQAQDQVSASVPGFEIEAVLGRGGMGVVYKARHLTLKRVVALKMVLGGAHAGPQALARFRIEAEAVARLHHPNIVQIHEVGEANGSGICRWGQPCQQAQRKDHVWAGCRETGGDAGAGDATFPQPQYRASRFEASQHLVFSGWHAQDHRLRLGQADGQ